MDRAADILHCGIAQDLDVAGFAIDLDVADMGRPAGTGALRVDRHLGRDRPAGASGLERDLLQ